MHFLSLCQGAARPGDMAVLCSCHSLLCLYVQGGGEYMLGRQHSTSELACCRGYQTPPALLVEDTNLITCCLDWPHVRLSCGSWPLPKDDASNATSTPGATLPTGTDHLVPADGEKGWLGAAWCPPGRGGQRGRTPKLAVNACTWPGTAQTCWRTAAKPPSLNIC